MYSVNLIPGWLGSAGAERLACAWSTCRNPGSRPSSGNPPGLCFYRRGATVSEM